MSTVGYERHVLICTNQRTDGHLRGCCTSAGGADLVKCFKRELSERGLKGTMRANSSGCLDHCEHGATVVVYPEGVWYGGVEPDDVAEIVESHLVGGQPVERLRIHRRLPKATATQPDT